MRLLRNEIGGQAVIEGVMMRNKDKLAVAVRDPKGNIVVKKERFVPLTKRNKLFGLFFVRGVFNLIDMLIIGIKTLNYSANISVGEKEEKLKWWHLALSLVGAIGFALFLFKFLPLLITQKTSGFIQLNRASFNILDGVIKMLFFVVYIYLISMFKDVKRVFQYHGAEHKAVYCYEAKEKLNVKNCKKYSTKHPRCGTSFVFLVFVISVFVYSLLPKDITFFVNLGYRILLLPVIAGISYEVLKLAGKYKDKLLFRVIDAPGIWLQRITTKEPDDSQLEVAIKALESVS